MTAGTDAPLTAAMTMPRRVACLSPVAILNALVSRGGFSRTVDIAYGPLPRQMLDVYAPPPGGRPAPIVFFIYGGGWNTGDRATYLFVGAALASRGYVTVIADYRLWPEVRFPVFLQDGAAALRWTLDNAPRFGGDPRRVALMGHSAGAYNAAMLTLDTQWLRPVGIDPRTAIAGMVGLAGPYDFLPLNTAMLRDLFGRPDSLSLTQPINFVTPDAPPLWLAAGNQDATVDPGNTIRLADRVRQVGGSARATIYPGVDHRTVIGAIAAPLRFIAPVLHDVLGFLETVTARPGRG